MICKICLRITAIHLRSFVNGCVVSELRTPPIIRKFHIWAPYHLRNLFAGFFTQMCEKAIYAACKSRDDVIYELVNE